MANPPIAPIDPDTKLFPPAVMSALDGRYSGGGGGGNATGWFYPNAPTDGTTSASAAIQAAIDAAYAAGGGTIYLRAGTYLITTLLTWRSGVSVIGSPLNQSTLASAAGLQGACIQVGGNLANPLTDVLFRDIEIDGSAVPSTTQSKGIFITFMKRVRFENVYIHDTTATGFGCDFLQDVVFDRCTAERCGRFAAGNELNSGGCSGFGIGTGAYATESVMIRDCVARNNVRYGIFVEYQTGIGSFASKGTQIIGNYIEGGYWGIGSCGVQEARIANNTVYGTTSHGVVVGISDATHGAMSFGDQIIGNRITGCGGRGISIDASQNGGYTPAYYGGYQIMANIIRACAGVGIKMLTATALSKVSIKMNEVVSGGSLGIDVSGSGPLNDSAIDQNDVIGNTGQGIRILASANRTTVRGNKSGDDKTSSLTQTFGLEFGTGCTFTDCDVRGNDFRNNATGGISQNGTLVRTGIRENPGYNPLGYDTLPVTASPMTYTVGPTPENLYIIGGTWTSVAVNGVTVATTAPGTILCQPYDVVTLTYTAAPTAVKRSRV